MRRIPSPCLPFPSAPSPCLPFLSAPSPRAPSPSATFPPPRPSRVAPGTPR